MKVCAVSHNDVQYVFGFFDDVQTYPMLLSNIGFETYEEYNLVISNIRKLDGMCKVFLPTPDLKKGEILINDNIHNHFKNLVFQEWVCKL